MCSSDLCELRGDWALEQDRAQHAVKTVQENARLYQNAEQKPSETAKPSEAKPGEAKPGEAKPSGQP